jgi:protein-S-isoprenylcysteine O-methyltransferase Ste14
VSERKFWMRWRVRAGYLVGVLYWLLAKPTPHSIVYGGVLAAFGLLVRGIASGHLRKDRELAVTGPYACTRNPLYLGSALLAAGFVVAGHSWVAGVLVAAYFGIFYYAVMRNEEEDLRARFGAAFAEYAARVPLFFPRAPKEPVAPTDSVPESNANFSLAQYSHNREYKALIGTAVGLGIMWVRMLLCARTGY